MLWKCATLISLKWVVFSLCLVTFTVWLNGQFFTFFFNRECLGRKRNHGQWITHKQPLLHRLHKEQETKLKWCQMCRRRMQRKKEEKKKNKKRKRSKQKSKWMPTTLQISLKFLKKKSVDCSFRVNILSLARFQLNFFKTNCLKIYFHCIIHWINFYY